VHQPLRVERVLGGRRVDEGGVDLAVARRLEHRQGRPRDEQDGDARVGAEGTLEASRQPRFGEGAVDAEAQRAAPLGRLLRVHATGEGRRRQGSGDEEAAARHPCIIAADAALPGSRGWPGPPVEWGSTPGLHWRHPQNTRAAAP